MGVIDVLKEIKSDVADIMATDFEIPTTVADNVPSDEDPGLTFESGKSKKGKTIETCVLQVDIRNSTDLNIKHQPKTLARLYSAFIKSVIDAVDHHNGYVRHIIGDRLMIVFDKKNCFNDALDLAVTLNSLSQYILDPVFTGSPFKVGIGIDFGKMLVIKVGKAKQGKERAAYKNLVWLGVPANISSKLTDLANKEFPNTQYRVKYSYLDLFNISGLGLGLLANIPGQNRTNQPPRLINIDKVVSQELFFEKLSWNSAGNYSSFDGNKLDSFEKIDKAIKYPPIMMSDKVYDEFKRLNPQRDSVVNGLWKKQEIKIKGYTNTVYGGDVIWVGSDKI